MEVKISVYASMGEELLVNMSFLEYMNSLSATLESAVDLLEAMLIIKTHYGNQSICKSPSQIRSLQECTVWRSQLLRG